MSERDSRRYCNFAVEENAIEHQASHIDSENQNMIIIPRLQDNGILEFPCMVPNKSNSNSRPKNIVIAEHHTKRFKEYRIPRLTS